jgi:hypothetical protein
MWRYAWTAIIALGLIGIGISSVARGQTLIGIAFVGLAVLRTGGMLWARRPRKPQPSIRLNLDDDAEERRG